MNRSPVLALSALLAAAPALAQDIDIGIRVVNNRLTTLQFIDGVPGPDERVFGSDLTLFGGAAFTDEPGYRASPGTFDQTGQLTITLRAALREWNGSDFSTVATERLNVQADDASFSIYSPASDPPVGDPYPSFSMGVGMGELHQHFSNYLVASNLSDPGAPGLYLLQFDVSTDIGGIERSLPEFLVYNYDQSPVDRDAAIQYVRDNIVPAPPASALLVFGALSVIRRRRA